MQCFGCSRKYGLFNKEYGCPNCGYSYCAKCLKRPMSVPKHNGKVENVCLICYDRLSKKSLEKVIDCDALPGVILSRASKGVKPIDKLQIEAAAAILEAEPPADVGEILMPLSQVHNPETADGTFTQCGDMELGVNIDSKISEQLKKLKCNDELHTDDEIRSRLSNLKGNPPEKDYSKKDLLLSTDQRNTQTKVNDLLEQFLSETQLDESVEKERTEDIQRRLNVLRDLPPESGVKHTNTSAEDTESEDRVLKQIFETYLAKKPVNTENALEEEFMSSIPLKEASLENEELPWCGICNEDAIYRCKGCEGELFCEQCFRECHNDDEEYRQHIKEKYFAPTKFKEDHF